MFPGGRRGLPPNPDEDARGARRLAAMVVAGDGLGVGIAVETHDSHPTARDVVRIIDADGCSGVAVIWDVLHTWLGQEEPADTAELLAGRLAYMQVKDVAARDDLVPLPLGDGTLPLRTCLDLVCDRQLTGWVSWEYERLWHPEVTGLDELAAPGRRWLSGSISRS